jgi:hypothetical protein
MEKVISQNRKLPDCYFKVRARAPAFRSLNIYTLRLSET